MNPWNRLRSFAGRLGAGDDGPEQTDAAIFLTQAAYRNHQISEPPAPQIRQRYFGPGLRGDNETYAGKARPGLLARLGFRRSRRAPGDEQNYFGTRINGAPHPSPKPEIPVKAAVDTSPPSVEEEALLDSLFGKEPPSTLAAAPLAQAALAPQQQAGTPQRRTGANTAPAAAARKKATAKKKKRGKMDRGDVTIASLGVLLGVTCALFPWYIFFNQEKFGVREFTFSGGGTAQPTSPAYVPQPVGKPFSSAEAPQMELDFFPTATLPAGQEPARVVPASEQPFPADRVNFRLVHVANGRAMIEDGDGLWVVQRGSQLPDASRVAAIEQRNGRWVLVTSTDKIVELSR